MNGTRALGVLCELSRFEDAGCAGEVPAALTEVFVGRDFREETLPVAFARVLAGIFDFAGALAFVAVDFFPDAFAGVCFAPAAFARPLDLVAGFAAAPLFAGDFDFGCVFGFACLFGFAGVFDFADPLDLVLAFEGDFDVARALDFAGDFGRAFVSVLAEVFEGVFALVLAADALVAVVFVVAR